MADPTLSGPIAWMARNHVAANLLMALILVGGIVGLLQVKQEVFPEFDLDAVLVSVAYPGAGPEEVEQGAIRAIEERVRGVDGVKRVTAVANEGTGVVTAELLLDAKADRVLADIKNEVDRIQTFPLDMEEPRVSLLAPRRQVVSLILYGEQERTTLHALAEKARSGILATGGATQVDIQGLPPREIAVEVRRETLRSYGLTLEQIAAQVAAHSLELPGGGVKTRAGELVVRVTDRRQTATSLADVVIAGNATGGVVTLGEIATLTDGYAETDQASYFEGKPAVRVTAYRVGAETPRGVAAAVRGYHEVLRAELPPEIGIAVWQDDSLLLQDRINLLVKNALMGLVLVIGVLALFLELRLALWVSVGIPISFMGAFMLMPAGDLSINMITLFALIVTLGIVVDDAIIIGENAFAKLEEGIPPLRAAIEGAQEMAVPVTFAILTTTAAFAPMLFVPGVMGKVFSFLPMVVIAVLLFSLIEGFFVLPAHLAHGLPEGRGGGARWIDRPRLWVSARLEEVSTRLFRPSLRIAIAWRYALLGGSVAMLLVAFGVVRGGWLPFNFFPNVEGDLVTASARLPYGSPLAATEGVRRALEQAAREAMVEAGGSHLMVGMYTRLGEGPRAGGPGGGQAEIGAHLVTVELALVASDERVLSAEQIAGLWSGRTPPLASVEALSFTSSFGPGAGAPVDVQLLHDDVGVLAAASEEVAALLRSYSELTDVQNAWSSGKAQLDYRVTPVARLFGLTGIDVARQLRSAFFGAEALREQRDRDEVRVMVRLPAAQRSSAYDLEALQVRAPTGGWVPLEHVATAQRSTSPTDIRREDGRRMISVSAQLAPGVPSSREVLRSLDEEHFGPLRAKYPGLELELAGAQREQREALGALLLNYVIALFVMYALLAIPFRSYAQPLIIMSAIPFGLVGAVIGHVLMGYTLSVISLFGVVALSGVVVNDSLVLIDATNGARARGLSAVDAVVWGATRRLRPILLTSLTTFFGLMPMILETSVQARFMIPMAISLGFGVLFTTFVILVLVPALYMILEDIVGPRVGGRGGDDEG